MNKSTVFLAAASVGAAVMYFLDPDRGHRRRVLLRDKAVHSGHKLRHAAEAARTDLRNRARGYRASLRSSLRESTPPPDEVLSERVRAAIGRVVSHPRAVEVSANRSVVTLSGPVLAHEAPLLIDRVLDVRGVQDVVARLEPHTDPGRIPALQGEGHTQRSERAEFLQSNWSPSARLAGGVAGGAAMLYGFASKGLVNKAIGFAGLALAARGATNLDLRELTGLGARRHAISVQKAIRINAPIERVFEVWSQCQNYPHFMTHVQEVRPLAGDRETRRWHWRVRGRSGMEFEFDTSTTAFEENRFVAWRTDAGAPVQHSGQVRFLSNPDGTTTADVTLAYSPVAGAVGHVIAKLLGDDPKHQLDDDLMRMKSFLETGKAPRDAAAPSAQAPQPAM